MKQMTKTRQEGRTIRHQRITRKLQSFHNSLPRLVVTKSNGHIYAQIFDDAKGITLVSASSLQMKLANGNIQMAQKVGQEIAQKALAKNIKKIVFDRGGNKYHGRVKALAEKAREAGLEF